MSGDGSIAVNVDAGESEGEKLASEENRTEVYSKRSGQHRYSYCNSHWNTPKKSQRP